MTFIGGSGTEAGGAIAIDASGNVALAGTTTSADYPVTDGSVLTTGAGGVAVNDAAITEIDPTGAKLVYSTLFGGDGNEATLAAGGIAMDSAGNIFVAMDTQSTNLTVAPVAAPGPFQPDYGGGISDGFLAIFRPVVTGATPHLKYCTYLGINAQATLTGVAVDSVGNAYLAGYTSDPMGTFAATNGFQTTFSGNPYDGFVMKILPSGTGASDLSYGTFLGGSGSNQILAIAVGKALPGTVYVTGTTTSADFPVDGIEAPVQGSFHGTANAFVSVIAQLSNGTTELTYSSYLGGSQNDAGLGIFFTATNQIYVTGSAKSWDFPWHFNFQPFSGDEDAFVAEIDPTSAGAASLLFATPLGGTAPAGKTASAEGNGVAVNPAGNFYVVGATTAGDFPRAGNPGSGIQVTCASCQQVPPVNDAFVVQGVPSVAAMPSVSFNAAKLNFGTQPVGSTTVPPQAVAAINTGDAALTITDVSITGTNAGDFSLIGAGACLAGPVAAGQKCSFEVGFVGSVVGPEEAFLSFTDNGPASPQTLALVAMGGGPFAVVSPGSVNFGNQPVNTKSSLFQEVTLTNTGNEPLSFTQTLSGPDAAQFPPASSAEACASGSTAILGPGQSCVVPFFFAPTTTGNLSAEVDFVDNSGGMAGSAQSVVITGVGTGAAPILTIAPPSLDFGTQPVDLTSSTQNVTFTNSGSGDLNISSFAITGSNAARFGFVAKGANACALPSGKLVAGTSCMLSVDFNPVAAGFLSATLSIADNAQGSPQSVALSGTGGTSGISIAPGSVNFSSETVGSASAGVPVSVTNTGSSPITMVAAISGADPQDFTETDTCSQSPVGAGKSCIVNVVFDPVATGSRSALVQISDNAPGSPQTIQVAGSAVQAAASITPANLTMTFGSQLAGTASAAQNVTVTNSGGGAAVLTVSSASLAPSTNFSLTNNCKAGLASNTSCTLAVAFAPPAPVANALCGSTAGVQNSVLTITDNAPTSPQTLTLSGTVLDFCLIPPGAISATVSSGGTAQFQLDAQSAGYAGVVALTCGASVPQGTCTVQPASVTFSGAAPVPFQVNVTTTPGTATPASGGLLILGGGPSEKFVRTITLVLFVAVLFALAATCLGGSGVRSRALRLAQTCAILSVIALGIGACGGGQSATVVTGTPSGTYPITITATASGGATRTIGLTLTVQ